MKNKVALTPQAIGLLQFIVPTPPVMTVKLSDPYRETNQHYEYRGGSTITMRETNNPGSVFQYTFELKTRELIVTTCTETTVSGQQVEWPVGYIHLRRPLFIDKPEEWEYQLPGDICVECIARFDMQEIDRKSCEVIHLSRMFHYLERQKGQPDMIVERYVAGHGIMQKLVLSNLKL